MTDHPESKGLQASNGSALVGLAYNSIVQVINAAGGRLTEAEARERERQYLQRLMHDCGSLDWLASVRYEDEDTPGTRLDSVYTALMTDTWKDDRKSAKRHGDLYENDERLSAIEVLNREPRWVLTGAPGSGKSAFVNFLSLCLAGEALGDSGANLEALTEPLPDVEGEPQNEPQPWGHGTLVPVRVILRDFAASAQFPAEKETGEATHLAAYLETKLETKRCGAYFPILEQRMRAGDALVLFDGLDEVAQAGERRKRLLQCVSAFSGSFGNARILVTCRPYAYEQEQWHIHGFENAALADFEAGQIRRFIDRWYASRPEYDPDAAKARGRRLKQAVLAREALRELAKRPLLLTLTAYLHANRYELPERRADLYERLLELLIEKWEKARFKTDDSTTARQRDQYSLAEFLQVGMDSIRLVLERLAFEAHAEQTELSGTADIPAQKLTHHLHCLADSEQQEKGQAVNIGRLSEYLRDRVGILYQRGGEDELDAVYTFPHRSFQEYLAASYFRREERRMFQRYEGLKKFDEWSELAAHLGCTDPDRWREVVLLAGGIKSVKEPGPVWDLLDNLVPDALEGEALSREAAWGLRLAGEILAENLKRDQLPRKKERILDRIQQSLPWVLRTDQLAARERAAAGGYLAKIGDPRREVLNVDAMQFCRVPAGVFFLGSTPADELAFGTEREGAGKHTLDCDYWLARFPITVVQFGQFKEETEFKPDDPRCLRGPSNAPVVYVSWDEATAFCDWLDRRWRKKGWLTEGYRLTLPSEPEWEKAAKGGDLVPAKGQSVVMQIEDVCRTDPVRPEGASSVLEENPLPQRLYPWSNELDDEYLNYNMNVGQVSSVGAYPGGASPYGCEEMSGNVWEWTRSLWGAYPYPEDGEGRRRRENGGEGSRVLRGGAFFNYQGLVRCACRDGSVPDARGNYIGFRVVLSPLR